MYKWYKNGDESSRKGIRNEDVDRARRETNGGSGVATRRERNGDSDEKEGLEVSF